MPIEISVDDPRKPDVRALLERHLIFCRSETPPEHSFALDVDGLAQPAIAFFSCRDGDDTLLGIGAIKELDPAQAELKSMHTAAEARGRGVGRALLGHLLAVARSRGYRRVSLETGTTPGFTAARALYEAAGFQPAGPFADYALTGDNTFYTLALEPAVPAPPRSRSTPLSRTVPCSAPDARITGRYPASLPRRSRGSARGCSCDCR